MEKKVTKVAAAVIPAVLCAVYFIYGEPSFIVGKPLLGAVSHHFFHVNALHLAVNCYASAVLISRKLCFRELAEAYVIASLSFLCSPVPSIGMSNMLYAVMGLRTPSFRSPWWRSVHTVVFLVVMVGYLFVPKVSALTHIISFSMGVILSCVTRVASKTMSDYGKANKR